MKYPNSFKLVDRSDGYEVFVRQRPTNGDYQLTYENGMVYHYTEEVLDQKIQNCGYDVVAEKPTFPDSFQFTHDTTSQLYEMTKLPHHALWACTQPGLASVGSGATYTAEEIAGHFKEGHWREISKAEPDEPEMLFPITYRHVDGFEEYIVTKSVSGELVWMEDYPRVYVNLFTEDELREEIKSGEMIVVSAGTSEKLMALYKRFEAPPAPSKEAAKGMDSLAINVSSEGVVEATERVQRLAQAVEDLNISLESLQSIFAETREVVFGGSDKWVAVDCVVQPFCCDGIN